MAATIARAVGYRRGGLPQAKEVHRLGGGAAKATAATWKTWAVAYVEANGAGYVEVERDGRVIHRLAFGPEAPAEAAEGASDDAGQAQAAPEPRPCAHCGHVAARQSDEDCPARPGGAA